MTPPDPPATFDGFPADAQVFLRELGEHNDKVWFDANRERYERVLRGPMTALVRELEGLFGPGKLFRQHRDIRFSKDKRPYKEWVAATVGGHRGEAARYVHLGREAMFIAAGAHQLDRERLTRFRQAVTAKTSGEALEAIVAKLEEQGYDIGGKTLSRGPRDADPDHPRIELLKHTGITMARSYEAGAWLQDAGDVTTRVVEVFGDAEPLIGWAREHLS